MSKKFQLLSLIGFLFISFGCSNSAPSGGGNSESPGGSSDIFEDSEISWSLSSLNLSQATVESGSSIELEFVAKGPAGELIDLPIEDVQISLSDTASGSSTVTHTALQRESVGVYKTTLTGVLAGAPLTIYGLIRNRSIEATAELTVLPGPVASLELRKGSTVDSEPVVSTHFKDTETVEVFAYGRDAAQNSTGPVALNWSLSSGAPVRFLGSVSSTNSVQFQVIRPLEPTQSFQLLGEHPSLPITIQSEPLKVVSEPLNISGLARWYRADAGLDRFTDSQLVGESASQETLTDFSPLAFHAYASSTARPSFQENLFGSLPGILFCRDSGNPASCAGADTVRDRLRLSVNLQPANWPLTSEDGKYESFTLFVVLRRLQTHSSALHIASVQSAGQNHGLYFGFPNSTTVSLGINGLGGSTKVQGNLGAFSNQAELFTGVYSKGSGSSDGYLRLYRGVGSSALAQISGLNPTTVGNAALFMNLGQGFSDANGKLALGDFMLFSRTLSDQERCLVQKYLVNKYSLGLAPDCN